MIKTTKTLTFPSFPELTGNKTSRTVTKHFTNLAMHRSADEVALMNWLVYQVGADNTFEYSQKLISKYIKTIVLANEEYNGIRPTNKYTKKPNNLHSSPNAIRAVLATLISNGYVLSSGTGILMLNPMLSFRNDYITTKEYEYLCYKYSVLTADQVAEFMDLFCGIINKKIKPKKL